MVRRLLVLSVLLVLLQIIAPAIVSATTASPSMDGGRVASASRDGAVHAVLFWMQGCSHCEKVKTETLPPLQQKYGAKLDILQVEVNTPDTSSRLDRVAQALGHASGSVGVPFLVIGDRGLSGSLQIPVELPGLIEKHLAAGGVDIPNLPGLENIASLAGASSTSPAGPTKNNGFIFAWAVLALLIAALLYAAYGLLRYLQRRPVPMGPKRYDYAFIVLCAIGLVVAFYLAFVETTSQAAVCGPVGDCNAVQSSEYARLFGILPVGVLGLAGYLAMLAAWLWARLRGDRLAAYAPYAALAMAAFGVIFSIYLTCLELFVIHAVCAWCLTSAVTMALILMLLVGPVLQRRKPAPAGLQARPSAKNDVRVRPAPASTAPRKKTPKQKKRATRT